MRNCENHVEGRLCLSLSQFAFPRYLNRFICHTWQFPLFSSLSLSPVLITQMTQFKQYGIKILTVDLKSCLTFIFAAHNFSSFLSLIYIYAYTLCLNAKTNLCDLHLARNNNSTALV